MSNNYYEKYSGNTGQKWQKMIKEGWGPRESSKLLQEGKAKSFQKTSTKRSYEPPVSQKRKEEPVKKKKKIVNEAYWKNLIPLSTEKKYIDVVPFFQQLSTTNPVIVPLNLCAEGTDYDQRIGRKINVKSIELKMNMFAAWAHFSDLGHFFLGLPCMVKISIIFDSQTNGTLPNIFDIYRYYTVEYANLTFLNADNRSRFKVLYNCDVKLDGGSSDGNGIRAAGDRQSEFIHEFIPVDLTTVYQGVADHIADISTGSILLVITCTARQGNLPTTNYPEQGQVNAYMSTRIRFVE